ncbi:MAG TPA: hypothetical protein VF853_05070, partial [Candidatus Deferrimicrobiaceae bacterium]
RNPVVVLATVRSMARLRAVCPEDPVKFDYPLTRLGILRLCTNPRRGICGECPVAPLCSRRDVHGAGK